MRDVTSSGDSASDVNAGEFVESEDEDWLVDLQTQDLWLKEGDGGSIDLDETLSSLAEGDCRGGLLFTETLNLDTDEYLTEGLGYSQGH